MKREILPLDQIADPTDPARMQCAVRGREAQPIHLWSNSAGLVPSGAIGPSELPWKPYWKSKLGKVYSFIPNR